MDQPQDGLCVKKREGAAIAKDLREDAKKNTQAAIATLAVEDVDLKRGSLAVCRSKKRKPVKETLAVGRELADHLKAYLAWRACRIADMDSEYRNGLTATRGALFVGGRGPLTTQELQRIWKAAVRRAHLPSELSIHSARHSLAVYLLKKTGNLRLVQKQLGHSSPITTANLYADVSFEQQQDSLTGLY